MQLITVTSPDQHCSGGMEPVPLHSAACADDAGWVYCQMHAATLLAESGSHAYRCPCCGDDVMARYPVCSDCAGAQCEAAVDASGEAGYWECQRDPCPVCGYIGMACECP